MTPHSRSTYPVACHHAVDMGCPTAGGSRDGERLTVRSGPTRPILHRHSEGARCQGCRADQLCGGLSRERRIADAAGQTAGTVDNYHRAVRIESGSIDGKCELLSSYWWIR